MPLSPKTQVVKVAALWKSSQLKVTPKVLAVADTSRSTTRAPSLLTETAATSSVPAVGELQPQEESNCLLSQSGKDGIGHQLEGKLSCMAMASFLGMEYVHKPFFTMQHVGNPGKMAAFFEEFFGFGTQFPSIKAHMREQKIKVPWVGHCKENGWLRLVELGSRKCAGPSKVIAPDNCWDRMYCHGYMESGHFYKLVPYLHAAYHSIPKPEANWTEGLSDTNSWGPKVAVHIRKGDSSYQLKLGWYVQQIDEVRQRFLQQDPNHPPLFRIQTDGSATKLVQEAPSLGADDIVIDAGKSTSLAMAIHRMITADAFIMSRSSLSMSMALIGNQSTVILPDCYERTSLPHWIRAPCSLPASDVATASTTRAPSLLPGTADTSSVPAVGELQPQEESNCLLSQSGKDGIGHQLEGKLSCMAMASFLGMEYVHKPFFTMQHVGNPGKMAAFFEEFFGFGTQFRSIKAHMREQHIKVPWVGHCKEVGWLRLVELGKRKCAGPSKVIAPDNCWDRMYCHGYMESGHFYKLVPYLHAAYHSIPKPEANWTEGLSDTNSWGPKVAVHIRKGDSSYQLKLGWYVQQIDEVRQRFLQQDPNHPPLFRIQTDGSATKLVQEAPSLGADDIVIDAGKSTSLAMAIHRMITADAFIMSRSSLSMSMALIGNQSTVILPDCYERTSLPHWIRAPCK